MPIKWTLLPLSLSRSMSNGRCVSFLFIYIEIPVLKANSVNPDQTPRSAASDLGLHYLPIYFLQDARYKWVQQMYFITCLYYGYIIINLQI